MTKQSKILKLPSALRKRPSQAYKSMFGHVLVLAGAPRTLGAAALTSLAAIRSGAGLVTLGVPRSLNTAAQKKIAHEVMTLPLQETASHTLSPAALAQIRTKEKTFTSIAIGPGLSQIPGTRRLILKIVETVSRPLIIDADALNALATHPEYLKKTTTAKILTPHPGEMARLIHQGKGSMEKNRRETALAFAEKYHCVLVLKGAQTVVADFEGKIYVNATGNPGMATAGSGDVLTGMIAALTAQGLSPFDAAKWGVYVHGMAGDLAARAKTQTAMIASDIIDHIPNALRKIHDPK